MIVGAVLVLAGAGCVVAALWMLDERLGLGALGALLVAAGLLWEV